MSEEPGDLLPTAVVPSMSSSVSLFSRLLNSADKSRQPQDLRRGPVTEVLFLLYLVEIAGFVILLPMT